MVIVLIYINQMKKLQNIEVNHAQPDQRQRCEKRECWYSGDVFYGEAQDFAWDDYIAYHLADGPDVAGYEFEIPQGHAKRIEELIQEYSGRYLGHCALTISEMLKDSGGIFSELPISRFPSGLAESLSRIPNVKIIKYRQ